MSASLGKVLADIEGRWSAKTPDEVLAHDRGVRSRLESYEAWKRTSAERERKRGWRRAAIPRLFQASTWATFETPTPAHLESRNAARAWKGGTWCLLFAGGPGSGKTHLATSALRDLEAEGFSCVWAESSRTLRELQAGFDDGTSWRREQRLRRVDVLLLDDLGAERVTDWARETLSSILRERYDEGRLTILTTNLDKRALGRWDPRLLDRVWNPSTTVVRVQCESWRQR